MRRISLVLAALAALLVAPVALAADPGDEPSTAIPASVGVEQFDSSAMTESVADPTSCGDFENFTNTMWLSYTAPRRQVTLVDVNSFVSENGSTDYLAILFVFARNGSSLDLVGCSAFPATVTFTASAGTTYLFMVGALDEEDGGDAALTGHGGTFALTIQPIRGRVLSDRFHAKDTIVDEFLSEDCGFPVTVSFDDRGISKTFVTLGGVRRFTFHLVGTTTFSGAGSSVTFTYAYHVTDSLDGNLTFVGLPVKVRVDGRIVVMDRGRIIFGPDGSVVFEAGHHPTVEEGVDICGALTG